MYRTIPTAKHVEIQVRQAGLSEEIVQRAVGHVEPLLGAGWHGKLPAHEEVLQLPEGHSLELPHERCEGSLE